MGNGALVFAGGHKTGNVGHVHNEHRAHFVGNGAEAGKVDLAGIGAGAGHDDIGLVLAGKAGHFVIIDPARFALHAVGNDFEQTAGEVDRAAVRQMPAVAQIHAQNGRAGGNAGQVGGHVGLRTGMGLYVGIFAAEELPGAINGELFGHIHIFATAVVSLARIAFGVLVGQHAALRFAHGRRDEVFRRDEFQFTHLTIGFQNDRAGQFRVLQQQFVHALVSLTGQKGKG